MDGRLSHVTPTNSKLNLMITVTRCTPHKAHRAASDIPAPLPPPTELLAAAVQPSLAFFLPFVQHTPQCRTCNSAGRSSPPSPPTPPPTPGRKKSIRTKQRPSLRGFTSTRVKKRRMHYYLPRVLARGRIRDIIALLIRSIINRVGNGTTLGVRSQRC